MSRVLSAIESEQEHWSHVITWSFRITVLHVLCCSPYATSKSFCWIFCEWRHKWSSFRVILAHVAWPRAQPL